MWVKPTTSLPLDIFFHVIIIPGLNLKTNDSFRPTPGSQNHSVGGGCVLLWQASRCGLFGRTIRFVSAMPAGSSRALVDFRARPFLEFRGRHFSL